MSDKIRTFLINLSTFILFSAIGIWIGMVANQAWSALERSGKFVTWQLLDSPLKFRQFVDANESEIWAVAENDKFYMFKSDFCTNTPGEACGSWQERDPHGEFDSGIKTIIKSGCQAVYDYYLVETRYPPQTESTPRECIVTMAHDPFFGSMTLTYYVLLDNGNVWMWKHKPDFGKEILTSLSISAAGLMIGIIVWFILRKRFIPKQPFTT